jgi:hypothetical protein
LLLLLTFHNAFAPLALALVAATMSFFGVATNNAGPRNVNQMAGVNMQYIDVETGLIKSWKGATNEDTKQLKTLIEKGMIDGFSTKEVQADYVRFCRFTTQCLGDKISNLRTA